MDSGVSVEELAPPDPGQDILASSSDHVVLRQPKDYGRGVGDMGGVVGFTMRYGGLVHAFTSPYVGVEYRIG